MGRPFHEQVATAAVDTLLARDDLADLTRSAWSFLSCSDAQCRCSGTRNLFIQEQDAATVTSLDQIAALTALAAMAETSGIFHQSFEVGAVPGADRNRNQHRHLVEALRPHGFDVSIDDWTGGANGRADGVVAWRSPLRLNSLVDERIATAPPRVAPLETGATTASRTLAHLLVDRALWRWPYGSTTVTLLWTSPTTAPA